jgi:multiple sugar transport system substrate-binding protein/putative aldouronate transport system substrate-binding protein
MRKSILLTAIMMIPAMVFAGGASQKVSQSAMPALSPPGLTGDDLSFSKFIRPVDVHIGMGVDPLDTSLPAGDSAGSNVFTRYLGDNYNINIIVDWTAANGEDYNQKVSLAIASNTLPDGLVTNYNYWLKAASSEMLYDLTDLFDKYASSQVKSMIASTGGQTLEMASYNSRLLALPNGSAMSDGVTVLNIQKNWLDQYGLSAPRTVDDIEKIARVFKERKPAGEQTIPIIGPDKNGLLYRNWNASSSAMNGFDPVFNAYNLYPGYFLDNGSGQAAYGSLDSKMKDVLQRLASWYQEGLIDIELGIRDNSNEPVGANVVGMRFAPWWGLGYSNGDSFKNNPNANWQAYPIYSDSGKWNSYMKAPSTNVCMVSKKTSPDAAAAIIIIYNAYIRDEGDLMSHGVNIDRWYPLRTVLAAGDNPEYEYRELSKILKGEREPEDYTKGGSLYNPLYKVMAQDAGMVRRVIPQFPANRDLAIQDFNINLSGDFNRIYALMIGDRPYATQKIDKEVYSLTYIQTELLQQRWANLLKMEREIMTKIVIGQEPISAFDRFVADWNTQGGQGVLDDLTRQFLKK